MSVALGACSSPETATFSTKDQDAQLGSAGASGRATDENRDLCDAGDGEPFCSETTDRAYLHPLQGLKPLPDGRLPFVEAHLSPGGKAYAIASSVTSHGDEEDDSSVTSLAGVVELDIEPIAPAERRKRPKQGAGTTDKLEPVLRTLVQAAKEGKRMSRECAIEVIRSDDGLGSDQCATGLEDDPRAAAVPIEATIRLPRTRTGTTTQRIHLAIAEGRIQSHADRLAVRKEELSLLREEVRVINSAVAARIVDMGGQVRRLCEYSPCLRATLTPGQIEELARGDDVEGIGTPLPLKPDAIDGKLDGNEKSYVYQTRAYWTESFTEAGDDYNYDGDNGSSTDIRVAVVDAAGFRASHIAFTEDGNNSSRIVKQFSCWGGVDCTEIDGNNNFSGSHGTQTLGAIFQDYRDNQDPNVTGAYQQRRRSATAGEARAYTFWQADSQDDQAAAFDEIQTINSIRMLVSSDSVYGPTGDRCKGDTDLAKAADDLYESGVAFFKSANNYGLEIDPDDCGVGGPGEAIGVFTIAAYDAPETGVCDQKNSLVHERSSRGGSTSDYNQGKFRSIIDLTGAWLGSLVANATSDTTLGDYSGTSHATPSVASAAIGFIDMYKNGSFGTNFIDDPGILYAWMLNMGDRRTASGSKMTSRFDHRTGAGNINMRFFNNANMDGPWGAADYIVNVQDGNHYDIVLNNGNALPSEVDAFRAVAWWYDRRIEQNIQIDNIDLLLMTTGGTPLRSSYDGYDNKERVYYSPVGSKAIKLRVSGTDVTADDAGCGQNCMPVYVTLIYEDNARDDLSAGTDCQGPSLL